MAENREIVITGVGPVSPIGIGRNTFWTNLCAGQGGIRPLSVFGGNPQTQNPETPLFPFGGEVVDFEGKKYVKPRKSIKVMSREIQLAFAAAGLAIADADLQTENIDKDRFGVVFGSDMMLGEINEMRDVIVNCNVDGKFEYSKWGERAMSDMYPLWMLKYLPNMAACHIGISVDARGPNNSIVQDETSSLSAMIEAALIIERGHADLMITGGFGTLINLTRMVYRGKRFLTQHMNSPDACRPFDLRRDGMVIGEGAGAIVLESRQHAESRGAKIIARLDGWHNCFIGHADGSCDLRAAVKTSLSGSLAMANVHPNELSHVNANGLGDVKCDASEAQGIEQVVGDQPVVALKSHFGNLGPGTGAVECIASILSLQHKTLPPTLNYRQPDPNCPVNVVTEKTQSDRSVAVSLNQTRYGNAVAVVLRQAETE